MCATYCLVYSKYVTVLISKQRYVEISIDQLESSLLGWQAMSDVSKSGVLPDVRSYLPVVRA
jgi:hypothetical protein